MHGEQNKGARPAWSIAFATAVLCLFGALAALSWLVPGTIGEERAGPVAAPVKAYSRAEETPAYAPMAFDEAEILSSLLAEEFDSLAETAAILPRHEELPERVYPEREHGRGLEDLDEPLNAGASPAKPPPAWQRYAKRGPDAAPELPRIAVVIDDLGIDRRRSARSLTLAPAITLAFLSYGPHSPELAVKAHAEGHEILLHVPMEPLNAAISPGPRALLVDQGPAEIAARILWGLSRVPNSVGMNNHMGSRFTADPQAMASVMSVLRDRQLLFLDSRTTAASAAAGAAGQAEIPFLARDVFLDPEGPDVPDIDRQLEALVQLAKSKGQAIGIGHPYDVTLDALEIWTPTLAGRGVVLVPLTALLPDRAAQSARLVD